MDEPDALSYSSKTALHYAAEAEHREVVELLLAKGADVWRRDAGGVVPVEYALRSSTGPTAQRLFAAGTRKDPDALGSVFQAAVIWGLPERVRAGLAAGADVHRRDFRGLAPINLAFSVLPESGNRARLILESRLGMKLGDWPLAGVRGEVVFLLLARGADPNSTGRTWSAAQQAVSNGGLEELKLLVKHGARLTPGLLDWAAGYAPTEMVKYLVSAGLAPDATGSWALHGAAGSSSFESVRILLAAGADPARPNPRGQTPLDKARERLGYSGGGAGNLALFVRMSRVLPETSAVSDEELMKAVVARSGALPLSPDQRDRVAKALRLVQSRFRGLLRDYLRQDRDPKAKARFEAALKGDQNLNWSFF
ncbi:MAG: ankyrin repeat protein [Elusimicrobia bacterium]|nr:MAG: ankyrin repeat protein [Elusimicrobiota bacterium]